jgi:NhaP-type Na+/H+ or K+/H+ antiporter
VLAVAGVLISMFVFGTAIYLLLAWLNLNLSYTWCVLPGVLISPTDPIAVLMSRWQKFPPGTLTIMTWGGLRGGISLALALSLPAGSERELVLAMTYLLVVFSILVQGSTTKQVVMRDHAQHGLNSLSGNNQR